MLRPNHYDAISFSILFYNILMKVSNYFYQFVSLKIVSKTLRKISLYKSGWAPEAVLNSFSAIFPANFGDVCSTLTEKQLKTLPHTVINKFHCYRDVWNRNCYQLSIDGVKISIRHSSRAWKLSMNERKNASIPFTIPTGPKQKHFQNICLIRITWK